MDAIFNNNIMAALMAIKVEILFSNKAFFDLQSTQFNDIKADLKRVHKQISELTAGNIFHRTVKLLKILKIKDYLVYIIK